MSEIESTLWIGGFCSCLQVPPVRSDRILSGEWRTDATICSNQRLRVTSVGETARIYIESRDTGELFAVCPIPPGMKNAYVLSAIDSSRNFLIRVEDADSGRHAFIGLSFTERGDAFDFSVALSDHERQVLAGRSGGEASGSSQPSVPSIPAQDLSLKQGQTIRVELKGQNKPKWLSMPSAGSSGSSSAPLLPPPAGRVALRPPPPVSPALASAHTSSALKGPSKPATSLSTPSQQGAAMTTNPALAPPAAPAQRNPVATNPPQAGSSSTAPQGMSGWATF